MRYSLTPFFNELDILEIRLATLDPVIDCFVITEATLTHSGHPKPLILREHWDRFSPWHDKIRYVVVDDMPDGHWFSDTWAREKHQRRSLIRGIEGYDPTDEFLLSDLDEIPHPQAIEEADYGEHLCCWMHACKLNWRWPGPVEEGWTISRVFDGIMLDKWGDLEEIRLRPWTHDPFAPVGWHLSYMTDIPTKLDAFVHQEMSPIALMGDRIKDALETGSDLYGRDHQCEWVGFDQLPPYIEANQERFAHLLIEAPCESLSQDPLVSSDPISAGT